MRLVCRRHKDGETDYELMLGVLFVPIATALAAGLCRLPDALVRRCWFHYIAGFACPTCGTFRSMRLLTSGALLDAWLMQPLVITAMFAALLYAVYSFVVVLGKLPRLRCVAVSRRDKAAIMMLTASLIILNWVYLVLHGV